MAGARLFGRDLGDPKNAADLASALGGLKGPLMKLAQMLATIPDLLPPEFAAELQKLQSAAPPMGPAFVKRRMHGRARAGLGEALPLVRPDAGRRRLARPGAPRGRPRRQARWP